MCWCESPRRATPATRHPSVGAADAGRKRKAAGQRFAEANHIGNHAAVFAGEPFSGAAEAGVNFVEDQQRAVFVAQFAEQRQKFRRRNVDAAARLNRFDQHRADPFAAEKLADFEFDGRARVRTVSVTWKRHEMPELAQLRAKWAAKMFAMRGVERAVAESVIRALKRDDAGFAGGEHRGLERGLHGFKTGIAENRFPVMRCGLPDC